MMSMRLVFFSMRASSVSLPSEGYKFVEVIASRVPPRVPFVSSTFSSRKQYTHDLITTVECVFCGTYLSALLTGVILGGVEVLPPTSN